MGYEYEAEKACLFTEEGSKLFLRGRDRLMALIKGTGAIARHKAESCFRFTIGWEKMACVDHMVKLGDIQLVSNGNIDVFVACSS